MTARNWGIPVLVALITAVGLAIRLVDITGVPTGLHGDEAIVGLEGQRVLREVIIEPYSPSAHGQPSAPFYLSALTVTIFGNTVVAVRLVAVIFGTLAIPALYFVVRRSLGTSTALLAAMFLAVMGWHIHYSRIAFPLPSWPLWVILTAGVVAYAARHRTPLWWAAAGAMTGLGVYTYNAHPLALAAISGFVVLSLLLHRWPITLDEIKGGAAYAGAMIATMLPMIWFILTNFDMYRRSVSRHSVRQSDEWQALDSPLAQAGFVLEHYGRYWWELAVDPRIDYVDAAGITETVPPLLLALSLIGLVIGVLRVRTPLVWIGTLLVLLMPFAAVLTLQGELRRTFVIAPFLAMFAAIAIVEVIRWAWSYRSRAPGWIAVAICAVVIAAGVTTDLRNYFEDFRESPTQHWVFAEPFADASHYMRDLPDDHYVYFMANRWSIDYEPRRFLAPDVRGENRSEEFGTFSLEVNPEQGRTVFILIGDYLPVLEDLEEQYPDGEVVTGGDGPQPTFIAYLLPAE